MKVLFSLLFSSRFSLVLSICCGFALIAVWVKLSASEAEVDRLRLSLAEETQRLAEADWLYYESHRLASELYREKIILDEELNEKIKIVEEAEKSSPECFNRVLPDAVSELLQ